MLPADVARCSGMLVRQDTKCSYTAHLNPLCLDCLRRTEPAHDRQVYMVPPDIIEGCPFKIMEQTP